jgi:hypothetical protein
VTRSAVDAPPARVAPVVDTEPRPSAVAARADRPTAFLRRPLVACLLLLAVYASLSLLDDPRAFLGTDTGGKVATLRAMDARGDLVPDLGYWAKAFDPHGIVHPIVLNTEIDGRFVNVTTLPMIYAAWPLYEIGGLRGILLIPMLGGVLVALAARALSRRLGGRGDLAFWLVGLATPCVVYALDFWEHTIGLALMAWGLVLLVDLARGRAGWRGALAAGALFGAAGTMRTESLVYVAAVGLVVGIVVARRQAAALVRLAPPGALGLAVPLLANTVLERAVLGSTLRSGRATGAAVAGGTQVRDRLHDALATTVGLNRYRPDIDWLLGGFIVLLVGVGARCLVTGDKRRSAMGVGAIAVALLLYWARFADGLGFVPGLLTASPLAVAGVFLVDRDRRYRFPVVLAVLPLPLVWVFEYSGGANPQWGGRYELLSGFVLAVVGVTALERSPRRATWAVVAVALVVTGCGAHWLEVRSHGMADAVQAIVGGRSTVVVTRDLPHLLREGGAFYDPGRRWLTIETDGELPVALRVLGDERVDSFRLVARVPREAPTHLGAWRRVAERSVPTISGIDVTLATYRR